ncbi:hypothetical protein BC834DRAFT_860900 [Gloeopeniophorella convolvens]|nr:hypothetical protein BC834DRAFT_860900 [Gloeopeniophorella convolvens]
MPAVSPDILQSHIQNIGARRPRSACLLFVPARANGRLGLIAPRDDDRPRADFRVSSFDLPTSTPERCSCGERRRTNGALAAGVAPSFVYYLDPNCDRARSRGNRLDGEAERPSCYGFCMPRCTKNGFKQKLEEYTSGLDSHPSCQHVVPLIKIDMCQVPEWPSARLVP